MASTQQQQTQNRCERCNGATQCSQCKRCDGKLQQWANRLDGVRKKHGPERAREYFAEIRDRESFREGDTNRVLARAQTVTRPNPPEEPMPTTEEGGLQFDED